jgi:formylglycine-generating enzyme required for sulfatase activity
MKYSKNKIFFLCSLLSLTLFGHLSLGPSWLSSLHADDFGEGDLKFHISFVPIASNAPSTNYFGDAMPHTDYDFRIGKTEVSIAQLLQARAADPRIVRSHIADFSNSGRVDRNTEGDEPKFGVHAPANYINIIECFKFCNWLTSGDPYQGAYKLIANANPANDTLDVNDYVDVASAIATYGTVYTVPTFDEWSKAAFMKPDGSGFSFYTNGSGSGHVTPKSYYGTQENFFEAYGEYPKDIVFKQPNERDIRYFDTEGNEQMIIPKRGPGGWNSFFDSAGTTIISGKRELHHNRKHPWVVGSSAREQNGTYDMFGNVGEYFQEVIDAPAFNDFRIRASCWNTRDGIGGNDYVDYVDHVSVLDSLEAFHPTYKGYESLYSLDRYITGKKNVGLRVVARGAVPEVAPMPEVHSTITAGTAHLHWESTVGRIYQLQYSNSLEEPNWVNLGSGIHGSGGTDFFVAPVNTEAEKNRFYRVVDFD